jgi:hypothetical protein
MANACGGSDGDRPAARGKNRFIDPRRSNVRSDLIEITDDKLQVILLQHQPRMNLRQRWIEPLSLLIAVALTLTTATFKSSFGLEGATWQAIVLLAFAANAVWLTVQLIRLARHWRQTKVVVSSRSDERRARRLRAAGA